MKICLLNNLYKPYARGGAEAVVEVLSKQAKNAGHDCLVVAGRPYFRRDRTAEKEAENVCYLPSLYPGLSRWPKLLRFFYHLANLFDFVTAARIKTILKRGKCDLVITNNLSGLSGLVPLAAKAAGAKHVHILHDIQLLHPSGLMLLGEEKLIDSRPARVFQMINRLIFRDCSIVISPSRWLMELHTRRGFFINSERSIKLNPITGERTVRSAAPKDGAPFVFLYAGQLDAHKGVSLLIEAFKSLRRRRSDAKIKLEIIGAGALSESLRTAGAGKGIAYLGRLQNKEVLEKMAAADCLVVPSLCYENSPSVVYEAASRGLLFIGALSGGLHELTAMFGGIGFRAGDVRDLEKKMQWTIENATALRKRFLAENEKLEPRRAVAASRYLSEIIDLAS